jgi:hypothetical protein
MVLTSSRPNSPHYVVLPDHVVIFVRVRELGRRCLSHGTGGRDQDCCSDVHSAGLPTLGTIFRQT